MHHVIDGTRKEAGVPFVVEREKSYVFGADAFDSSVAGGVSANDLICARESASVNVDENEFVIVGDAFDTARRVGVMTESGKCVEENAPKENAAFAVCVDSSLIVSRPDFPNGKSEE